MRRGWCRLGFHSQACYIQCFKEHMPKPKFLHLYINFSVVDTSISSNLISCAPMVFPRLPFKSCSLRGWTTQVAIPSAAPALTRETPDCAENQAVVRIGLQHLSVESNIHTQICNTRALCRFHTF